MHTESDLPTTFARADHPTEAALEFTDHPEPPEACAEAALRLRLENAERDLLAAREELAEQTWLGDIGALAGPVAHGFNNFLNVLLLHIAVLERKVPEGLRADLAELRRQGAGTAALVKRLQQGRRQPPLALRPLDLNPLVSSAIEALFPNTAAPHVRTPRGRSEVAVGNCSRTVYQHVPVQMQLAPQLPPVQGSPMDLKRLVTFLARNAAAAAFLAGGAIAVRTQAADGRVILAIDDSGAAADLENPVGIFELEAKGRAVRNPLELAACKAIVGRLNGHIRAENRPGGGMSFVVELPAVIG